jgi:hypothetical protein
LEQYAQADLAKIVKAENADEQRTKITSGDDRLVNDTDERELIVTLVTAGGDRVRK